MEFEDLVEHLEDLIDLADNEAFPDFADALTELLVTVAMEPHKYSRRGLRVIHVDEDEESTLPES